MDKNSSGDSNFVPLRQVRQDDHRQLAQVRAREAERQLREMQRLMDQAQTRKSQPRRRATDRIWMEPERSFNNSDAHFGT